MRLIGGGLRAASAMSRASIARLASRWSAIAQPTTLREKASRIAAR